MKVTSQMVKALQKRIDVTYEEAERMLLKTNGNLDRAEELLKKQQDSAMARLTKEIERIYRELLTYYLKVTRKDKIIMDIPLLVVVGLFIIMTSDSKIWVGIVSIGIILISECTVAIHRVIKEEERIIRKEAFEEAKAEGPAKADQENRVETALKTENDEDKSDDDYYEITIEK